MPTTTSDASGAPEALTAFIDQGSEFEGKLSFKNTVRIDGCFKGEISSENTLIVGEPGVVDATIHSRHVIVSGEVAGDIVASERLVLHKTARVHGDIQTPKLVVEDGAELEGSIRMGANASAKDKPTSNGQVKPQGEAAAVN
ncbi:MAG: polymer-forming cytoskeletal protein [Deltaproteobacteria bacterium]|nr:polymer-forming cytoskeletal protein [Deltaproteobacteria bacterium]MBW2444928.1 polymer-forming cytoskeletal protein [Deltaproteobacteria bacterium]